MQLKRLLDFYGVTDHAMFLGVYQEAADTSTEFSKYELASYKRGINSDIIKGSDLRPEGPALFR